MGFRAPSHTIAVFIAGTTVAACGTEDVFQPELASTERLVDVSAVAQLGIDDQALDQVVVVGDLDGDGIDDAVLRTGWVTDGPDGFNFGSSLYVLYGGAGVTGKLDLAKLPSLTGFGDMGGGLVAAGDVDGDGLADFLVGVSRPPGCGDLVTAEDQIHGGAYLVYGSATRLTGATPIGNTGAFLRHPAACVWAADPQPLGDVDGDGHADFAVGQLMNNDGPSSQLFVFYGRGARLSGVVDLAATADAVITAPSANLVSSAIRAGDVNGDGHADFLVQRATGPNTEDIHLVLGAAQRLSGVVAPTDIAHTELVGFNVCLYGSGAALGDLDGDGFDDFSMIGCKPSDAGLNTGMAHHVFYGRAAFAPQLSPANADATITTSGAGASNVAAADLDGDGFRDLVVSDTTLHGNNGGVHILRGSAARLSGTVDPGASTTYVGRPQLATRCDYLQTRDCIAHDMLGADISIGDLTGDHHPDILASAPTDQLVVPDLGVHGSSMARAYLVSPPLSAKP